MVAHSGSLKVDNWVHMSAVWWAASMAVHLAALRVLLSVVDSVRSMAVPRVG